MTFRLENAEDCSTVVIPRATARALGLRAGVVVELELMDDGKTLRCRHRRPRRPLDELVRQLNRAAYRKHSREWDADGPVGR